ncbi:LysE family translocator [Actinoallomurus rhizosphaericola]|uniref:LysE family translocator n=1 Tax=Actinoallomurus rhizosphaericola TaxID=2952536 RepID=UPI002092DD17|nr:LysE family translocator [Actinoallomurus rhizosphaericola]MCO5997008.1 LysE family translocator [Actinoallomurus rhizosphaericola]
MVQSLIVFVGAAFLVAMVPGPSTAVIVRESVRSGRRAGVAVMLGNEAGVLLWGLAAVFGLSALLLASRVAYDVMRVAGAVFLIGMGTRALWRARRDGAPVAEEEGPAPAPARGRLFRLGLLTNAANPKAGVFAVSFLPQFVPHGVAVPPMLALLALVWALVDVAWYLGVIWLAGRAGRLLRGPRVRRRMEQVSGVVLVGLGIRLVTDSR